MSTERKLPRKRNPIFDFERTPDHSELVSRRRLGQTTLHAKTGQVGTTNSTKPENLGYFEYAHLKVYLPDNLKGTGIFEPPYPEAYFLMRRSSDGFVSATGMFKATFPWAKGDEEKHERKYIMSLPTTSRDEVAGNIWVAESTALELARDYAIIPWVVALLDSSPIQPDDKKAISPPPKYKFTANEKTLLPPPSATPARGRGRPRASSPTKKDKLTSPRKRTTKASKEAEAVTARQASETLQAALDAASVAESESVEPPSVNGDALGSVEKKPLSRQIEDENDKVTVKVQSAVETNGDIETTHTTVSVKMPPGNPELPLPENTEDMIATAKEMVQAARKMDGEPSKSSKRKADVLDTDEEDAEGPADGREVQPAKRTKLMEQEVRTQKVRNRAIFGVAASLAIGALIPYVLSG